MDAYCISICGYNSAHDLQNTLTKLYQKPELDEFVSCKWISFRVETTTKTDAKSTKFMGELEKDEDSSMPPLTDEPMPALADFDNNSSNDDDEKQRSWTSVCTPQNGRYLSMDS